MKTGYGFFVALCGDKTPTSSGLFDLVRATYSWPCVKQGSVRSIPHTASVFPSALLIIATSSLGHAPNGAKVCGDKVCGDCFLFHFVASFARKGAN